MQRKLPAYPLWIIDPDFSVWSKNDTLNGGDAIFWQGTSRRTYGLVRFGGKTYCFLGRRDDAIPLVQKDVSVTAFETAYTFACADFTLRVRFVSPLPPDNLETLSCPVCYTRYEVKFKRKLPEDFSVALVLDEEYCYSAKRAPIIGGVLPCGKFEAAFMTRRRNLVASDTSDTYAPDHGYTYLAGEESFFVTEAAVNRYVAEGKAEYLRESNERSCVMSVNRAPRGSFMTAHDDLVSVFYFGEWLKRYYFRNGKTIVDALAYAFDNEEKIVCKCRSFDKKLRTDCNAVGEGYYLLACAALRQTMGGHKLVQNGKGELLFLSKECDSNGCIGTVDVSYPSMPLFLLYNPELVNAMMRGIFAFARMPVWTFGFAPHDLGTYPWCSGQVYGVREGNDKFNCGMLAFGWGEGPKTQPMLYLRPAASNVYNEKMQMPVEECGNMLIMTAAVVRAGGSTELAARNFDLLEKWVGYLEKYGLKPALFDKDVKDTCDFWSINIYTRSMVDMRKANMKGERYPFTKARTIKMNNFYLDEFYPETVCHSLMRLKDKPVYITENGYSCEDDRLRIVFLTEYLSALHTAIEEGVDVRGYLYWSLLDNYEWGSYLPKFGLVSVDRANGYRRTPKPSAYFYQDIIQNNGYSPEILKKYLSEIPRIGDVPVIK